MKHCALLLLLAALLTTGCSDDSSNNSGGENNATSSNSSPSNSTSGGTTGGTADTSNTTGGTSTTGETTGGTTGGTTGATTGGTTGATTGGTTGGTTGPEEGALVMAEDGGMVLFEGSALDVPAGALAEDVRITVTSAPPSMGAVSDIYDFGPDGLEFQIPATLFIDADVSPADDETFVLAVWDEESEVWSELNNSAYDEGNGLVSGDVEHFSRFTIIAVPGGSFQDSECSGVVDTFTACGGDLLGTWTIAEFCTEDVMVDDPDYGEQCPSAVVVSDVVWSGSATITEAEVMTTDLILDVTHTSTFDVGPDCFGGVTCAEWEAGINEDAAPGEEIACSEAAGVCTCAWSGSQLVQPASTIPYTRSGSNLEIPGTDPVPYCVDGDQMVLLFDDEPVSAFIYQRQ